MKFIKLKMIKKIYIYINCYKLLKEGYENLFRDEQALRRQEAEISLIQTTGKYTLYLSH